MLPTTRHLGVPQQFANSNRLAPTEYEHEFTENGGPLEAQFGTKALKAPTAAGVSASARQSVQLGKAHRVGRVCTGWRHAYCVAGLFAEALSCSSSYLALP